MYESESGHIVEIDDTPYAERMYRKHRTGTFQEWDADGNAVTRIIGNNYTIVCGTDFVNVKGDVNLTIDSNCKTYIKGDWDIQVDGNKTETVKGNVIETYTSTADFTHETIITGTRTETVSEKVTENYKKEKSEEVGGNLTENYKSNQNTKVGSVRKLQSGSEIDMDAGVINLN